MTYPAKFPSEIFIVLIFNKIPPTVETTHRGVYPLVITRLG